MASFQWVFDNAESISVNKRPIVSQTIARDQRVRSISRGGAVWRFTVKMPTGMRWSDNRGYIEDIDTVNLLKAETVSFPSTGYDWYTGYRGAATSTATMTFKYNAAQAASDTTKFELGNMPGAVGSALFKAGDLIQPGSSKYVYMVRELVTKGSSPTQLVGVHRSILETPSDTAVTMKVGNAVSWSVICVECPTWTIVERDIVAWNGDFLFYEVL
ncbi:hypothetical protein [Brevundimonas sp.]|jgi:hypothetical protein|uniref:hypothetical protein n=1 Tax=Brevundimonas sp. TaxID=1871086 RepID=UPI0037847573